MRGSSNSQYAKRRRGINGHGGGHSKIRRGKGKSLIFHRSLIKGGGVQRLLGKKDTHSAQSSLRREKKKQPT